MIDTAIDQCYECKVTTKDHREEPIKVTNIPSKPWDTVSVDHGGPYPDSHYNLVMIDKRTRYPVVELVLSTNFPANKERMKHIFATYNMPRRVETDNGPPFNS
ncbi:Retrovirus-related Pol poly from transposon [Paramuricea clavata]|uniref:Retrovirus-related Pol poly from transposon n=1 Tax=Paramuricea clavata TaxID=317549 RepID=A0A6S7IE72_PARCT|nr:Retrovirus-related Pol poly from transposon [Paramuricea clavata]